MYTRGVFKIALGFVKIYLFTWILSLIIFALLIYRPSLTIGDYFSFYGRFIGSSRGLVALHFLYVLCLLLWALSRYLIKFKKYNGWRAMFKRLFARILLPIGLVVLSLKTLVYINTSEDFRYSWDYNLENKTGKATNKYKLDGKHRGMTVYRIGRNRSFPVDSLLKSNTEWVAVLPYFYQENEFTHQINSRITNGTWSRRDSSYINGIQQLREKGLRVFLKPHLWLGSGWRSNINLPSRGHWDEWFKNYRSILLHYAQMAELTGAEMLCIGTELKTSIINQPEEWSLLIAEIRQIYSGKLTYAANWDAELDKVTFWGQLDYIGVQAYFPLTENRHPELKDIKQGWQLHIARLKALSKKHNKPVLFTEVGYKNQSNATIRPWEWGSFWNKFVYKKSNKTQQLAFRAMYEELWDKPWFAGSYIWQWQDSQEFAVRGKPAENELARWYGITGAPIDP